VFAIVTKSDGEPGMNFASVVRSTLKAMGRKCIETNGDVVGAVDFTYPLDYEDGVEFVCLVSINPDGSAKTVLYKMENLVDKAETHPSLPGLLGVVEKFMEFCKRCDTDREHLSMIKRSKNNLS
jgi:hypothetical protein